MQFQGHLKLKLHRLHGMVLCCNYSSQKASPFNRLFCHNCAKAENGGLGIAFLELEK